MHIKNLFCFTPPEKKEEFAISPVAHRREVKEEKKVSRDLDENLSYLD